VTRKYCPEAMLMHEYPGSADRVVLDNAADDVYLPHVDSCVALCFKLSSGEIHCAHISQGQGTDLGMDARWADMLVALKAGFGNAQVTSLYGIGSTEWGPKVCSLMMELDLDPGDNAWWWGNSKLADGVDVTVQFNGSITVDDHKTRQRLGKFDCTLV
jgi:hypothetical protein